MKDQRLLMTVSAMVLAAFAGSALAEAAPDAVAPADAVADIVRAPDDLPRPLAARGPEHVVVDMETVEVTGQLADGATYRYWTYNEQVPVRWYAFASAIPSRCGLPMTRTADSRTTSTCTQ